MLNNPADMLSIVLGGALGRSGRKRARRAASFLSGKGGFLTASTLITAAGVVWGIYDSVKGKDSGALGAAGAVPQLPPPVPLVPQVPGVLVATGTLIAGESLPSDMLRVIRLAVSAAKADGTLTSGERQMILDRAREAGLESIVDAELGTMRPLGEIVSGVSDPKARQDLYVLAFTIVRADESVSGAERIYLAQLAYQLGLDAAMVGRLEAETAAKIDSQD